MIPKIIHYIWLGNNPIPAELAAYIDSWHKHMPDYQIMKWDDSVISQVNMTFVNEAIQVKKWAFASDVIRLWALYNYGGIYLDTDVKVLKSFDPLLNHKAFIGRENCLQLIGKKTDYHLTSFCFGAEKGSEYIKRCLDYYKDRHFITSMEKVLPMELQFDVRNASFIHSEIAKTFGYDPSALAPNEQICNNGVLKVLPSSYFVTPLTDNTFCQHLSIGSWREKPQKEETYTLAYKIKWRIRALVEKCLRRFGYIMVELN